MITGIKNNIEIENYLIDKKKTIDRKLRELFEDNNLFTSPKELWDAVKYSLFNGGKRIRGILCTASFESLEGNNLLNFDDCLIIASAIEIIHAMSLIHDDLPCMDNDDIRRGKPSCHKAFSESTAILTGDAMLTLPFYLIINKCKNLSNSQKINILNTLSFSTTFGLVAGQILDLSIIKKSCTLKYLENIYRLKTAELIKSSIVCGALTSTKINSDNSDNNIIIKSLSEFGIKLGAAFQIIDDILDISSDTKTLGKTSGKDKKLEKPTFPSIVGIEESRRIAEEMIQNAYKELKRSSLNFPLLEQLGNFILNRIH